jgi:quercetin dioxygenase-like cupin family protein
MERTVFLRWGSCMSVRENGDPRRLVVGLDPVGGSTVTSDAPATPLIRRATGNTVHDLWRQVQVPAEVDDDGISHAEVGEPPEFGAVVRLLTLPPNTTGARPVVDLHVTPALFVITILEGRVLVALDRGEWELHPGETIVIPGSRHDVGNLSDAPARMVFTAFPLAKG